MAKKDKKTKTTETAFEPYRVWLAGIGAAARAQKGELKLFESLVDEGRSSIADRGKKVKKKVKKLGDDIRDWFDNTREDVGSRLNQALADAVHSAGVPTTEVIEDLTQRVEELTERLADMEQAAPDRAEDSPQAEVAVIFEDDQWVIRAGDDILASHPTKAPAVAAAKTLAVKRTPCTLVVYKRDGAEQSRTQL